MGAPRFLACFLAAAVVLTACSGTPDDSEETVAAAATSALASATPLPTLPNAGEAAPTPGPAIIAELAADLSRRLDAAPSDVHIVSVTPATWPDACLGIGTPGSACAQGLVPGWLAILAGPDGREYRYRGAADRFILEPATS